MVVEVDRITAAVPWEMLRSAEMALAGQGFVGLSSAVARQLRTHAQPATEGDGSYSRGRWSSATQGCWASPPLPEARGSHRRRRGVRNLVGTARAVADESGLIFSEAFYKVLLGVGDDTLGEAVVEGRKRTHAERLPDWDVYQLYGDPGFQFTPAHQG